MANNKFSHQDWEPVHWDKKTDKKKDTTPRPKRNAEADRLRKLEEEDESFSVATVSLSVGRAVQMGRHQLKLSQKDLAQRLNIGAKIITDYENGKAIPSNQLLQRMQRILKIRLTGKNIGQPIDSKDGKKPKK